MKDKTSHFATRFNLFLQPAMDQNFHLVVLQKFSPSLTYVGELTIAVGKDTMDLNFIKRNVRDYIKSRQEFDSFGGNVDHIEFLVHRVRKQQTFVVILSPWFRVPSCLGPCAIYIKRDRGPGKRG